MTKTKTRQPARAVSVFSVVNQVTGLTFNVRVVRRGDVIQGKIHDDEALVQFYDNRYKRKGFDPNLGQFVTEYYATSIRGHGGLCLDGGIDDWYLDKEAMRAVRAVLAVVL